MQEYKIKEVEVVKINQALNQASVLANERLSSVKLIKISNT